MQSSLVTKTLQKDRLRVI